jgi:hypothetical protein
MIVAYAGWGCGGRKEALETKALLLRTCQVVWS